MNWDDYCSYKYGYNSKATILGEACECKSGYVFNSRGSRCVSGESYCEDKYGDGAKYDIWDKQCECENAYKFVGNKCKKKDEVLMYKHSLEKQKKVQENAQHKEEFIRSIQKEIKILTLLIAQILEKQEKKQSEIEANYD